MIRQPEMRMFADLPVAILDGFAGGGGASTGIEMGLGVSPDYAINHDADALAMHLANHPTTQHVKSNIRRVDYAKLLEGQRLGLAWFSPDCTFHSKAKGGAPFRDRKMARRARGLAWELVRLVKAIGRERIDVAMLENVEEWIDWCRIGADGRPDMRYRGENFRRWKREIEKLGGAVEYRELEAHKYGAGTSRKRLFVIVRFDGQPIVWPSPTVVPTTRARKAQYVSAADSIDFSLPVPSIFLTPAEAKAWGAAHCVAAPRRPLAENTLRRIARGMQRYVIGNKAEPFIVNVRHHGSDRVYSQHDPLRTIPASDREFALVVPTLIQTGYGEREGQAPRSLDILSPLGTIVGTGKHALVAAFLAKHNGGHEATGQPLFDPVHAITTVDQKALVTSHLVKFYGTSTGAPVSGAMPAITAGGQHIGEVRAFLCKYNGTAVDGISLFDPIDTIPTHDRFALVTVMIGGEPYFIADIGMRMLTPAELFRAQGFPKSYVISHGIDIETRARRTFTKRTQTRLVGNSVVPQLAAALVTANVPHLRKVQVA